MRQVLADIWETQVENPFPGLTTHAYLLTRESGNVLLYSTGHAHELDRIRELGGVAWQYLSHEDEVGEALNAIAERFGSRLGGHVEERAAIARVREPDILFTRSGMYPGGVEVLHTPGHSPGSVCFVVDSPQGMRYLFTGDTLYRNAHGGWTAGFIPGHSDPADGGTLATSLRLLRDVRPDVVFGSAFGGEEGYQAMRPDEWPALVDDALRRLERTLSEARAPG